jgi:hypothetical protein
MSDLHAFLAGLIRETRIPQRDLAATTGFSEKHVSQMMTTGVGLIDGWDRLLHAAGVELPPMAATGAGSPEPPHDYLAGSTSRHSGASEVQGPAEPHVSHDPTSGGDTP